MIGFAWLVVHSGATPGIPVDPDAPHARDLLQRELGNPAYQAARPTWLDIASKAVGDWLASLFQHPGGLGNSLAVLGLAVVICLLVGALIIFGVPKLTRRRAETGELFEASDRRTAAELRRAAEASAAAGDYTAAIADMFRAAATALAERTIIAVNPGTTAHEAARRAGAAFPDLRDQLADGADWFDGVRYLGRQGTADGFRTVSDLETALRAAKPVLPARITTAAGSSQSTQVGR